MGSLRWKDAPALRAALFPGWGPGLNQKDKETECQQPPLCLTTNAMRPGAPGEPLLPCPCLPHHDLSPPYSRTVTQNKPFLPPSSCFCYFHHDSQCETEQGPGRVRQWIGRLDLRLPGYPWACRGGSFRHTGLLHGNHLRARREIQVESLLQDV